MVLAFETLGLPWFWTSKQWIYNGFGLSNISLHRKTEVLIGFVGYTAPGYNVSYLWPTQETVAGAAQTGPLRSRAPKSFTMIIFSICFVRVSRGEGGFGERRACIWAPVDFAEGRWRSSAMPQTLQINMYFWWGGGRLEH